MKNIMDGSRGRSQGVPKIFSIAHCAVIFATAQLSCLGGKSEMPASEVSGSHFLFCCWFMSKFHYFFLLFAQNLLKKPGIPPRFEQARLRIVTGKSATKKSETCHICIDIRSFYGDITNELFWSETDFWQVSDLQWPFCVEFCFRPGISRYALLQLSF